MNHEPTDDTPWPEFTEVAAAIESSYHRTMRWEPRLRRAARALADLGAPVSADWIMLDDAGVAHFAPLDATVFDRLVCLLEDIAAQRPVEVTVLRGGPTLFGAGAPPAPAPVPAPSSVHLVVPS